MTRREAILGGLGVTACIYAGIAFGPIIAVPIVVGAAVFVGFIEVAHAVSARRARRGDRR